MCIDVLPTCMSAWGSRIPWSWRHRQPRAGMWLLGTEPRVSRRKTSTLNHWAIFPVPTALFYVLHTVCTLPWLINSTFVLFTQIPDECTEKILPPSGSSLQILSLTLLSTYITHMDCIYITLTNDSKQKPAHLKLLFLCFLNSHFIPSHSSWKEKNKRCLTSFSAILITISSPIHYHIAFTQTSLTKNNDLLIVKFEFYFQSSASQRSLILSTYQTVLVRF